MSTRSKNLISSLVDSFSNSKNNSDCYFAFPDNLKVNRLDPICFDYNWEYKYYNSDKYFKLNLNGLTARAFYVR